MFPEDIVLKEIFRPKSDSLHLISPYIEKFDAEIVAMANGDQLSLWNEITKRSKDNESRSIAKIFYYHSPADSPLMRRFREKSNVVHLIRKNLFDVYVSGALARRTSQWQSFVGDDDTPAPEPFSIDRSELTKFFKQRLEEIRVAREYFNGRPNYHEFFYEDLAEDPGHCANAIAKVFGVQTDPDMTISQRKQKSVPNKELITNYAEVADLDTSISWVTK